MLLSETETALLKEGLPEGVSLLDLGRGGGIGSGSGGGGQKARQDPGFLDHSGVTVVGVCRGV